MVHKNEISKWAEEKNASFNDSIEFSECCNKIIENAAKMFGKFEVDIPTNGYNKLSVEYVCRKLSQNGFVVIIDENNQIIRIKW